MFQDPVATLSLSLTNPDGSLRWQKTKATLRNRIIKDYLLSELDTVLRNKMDLPWDDPVLYGRATTYLVESWAKSVPNEDNQAFGY